MYSNFNNLLNIYSFNFTSHSLLNNFLSFFRSKMFVVLPLNRPMAVGALGTIVTAGICVIIQAALDYNDHVIDGNNDGLCDDAHGEDAFHHNATSGDPRCVPNLPNPTVKGFFTAFSSIMFAFGGASTFPTIQADMKERSKFPISALMGCSSKFNVILKC